LPNICVIIATRGRAELLAKTVRLLDEQSLPPTRVIIACASEDDLDIKTFRQDDRYRVIIGKPGLPAQRNLALNHVPKDCDYVVFFDDDFVADSHWLEAAAAVFRQDPQIDGLTGDVIADGVKGPGIAFDEALRLVAGHRPVAVDRMIEGYSPYGCNMAFRWRAARDLRFDERLVLYGWQEDRDFGATLAKHGGRLVKIRAAFGVHLGVKTGRGSGRRLGYSQIVNPLYLGRKGTMSPAGVFRHIASNVLSNFAGSIVPQPHVDRRGRLNGNFVALRDLMRGQAQPERAEQI
jgi:glycosyltransferase involved in cell wall biosynthesis